MAGRQQDRRSSGQRGWQLIFDSSYDYATLLARGNLQIVDDRALGGLFGGVTQVHSFTRGSDVGDARMPQTFLTPQGNEMIEPRANTRAAGRGGRSVTELARRLFKLHKSVRQLNRVHPFTVVRGSDSSLNGLLGLWFSRLLRIPLVVRINTDLMAQHERLGGPMFTVLRFAWLENAIARLVLGNADLVLAPTLAYRDYAIRAGARGERIAITGFGPMLSAWHRVGPSRGSSRSCPCASHGGSIPAPFLLAVLRLEPDKSPEDLVEVVSRLSESHPEVHLVVLGDGSQRGDLESASTARGLDRSIHFLGDVTQEDVRRYLEGALAVLSTHGGRSLLEAILAGKAVVAYDHDWQREVVRDGETGFLVKYRDTKSMAEAAAMLVSDSQLRHTMECTSLSAAQDLLGRDAGLGSERAAYEKMIGGASQLGWHS